MPEHLPSVVQSSPLGFRNERFNKPAGFLCLCIGSLDPLMFDEGRSEVRQGRLPVARRPSQFPAAFLMPHRLRSSGRFLTYIA